VYTYIHARMQDIYIYNFCMSKKLNYILFPLLYFAFTFHEICNVWLKSPYVLTCLLLAESHSTSLTFAFDVTKMINYHVDNEIIESKGRVTAPTIENLVSIMKPTWCTLRSILLRIKGLYMFRELLAHPQEALHKQHLVYCVQFHCNRDTANWHYTHAIHQVPFA
jgi:hypothetical protein